MSARAQPPRRRQVRVSGRAAVLAAVIVALLATGVVPLRQYVEQRSEIDALEQQVDLLLQEREKLERRIVKLQDPEYLQLLARKCLGMVKRGEIAFVAVPEGGKRHPAPC